MNITLDRLLILPADTRQKDIMVPNTPNINIIEKFLKNCFFFTWKLKPNSKFKEPILNL